MKRVPILSLFFLLFAGPQVLAQMSDTTSAWRYLPLQVDNVWEYQTRVRECLGTCDDYIVGYARWHVKEEVVVEGHRYAVLDVQNYGEPSGTQELLVRFDTLTARGVKRTADGSEEGWPGDFSCRLNAAFGVIVECDYNVFASTGPSTALEVQVNGETETRVTKGFHMAPFAMVYTADVGLYSSGEDFNPWEWRRTRLTFARVGDIEYGTEQYPVAAEPTAPEESALALSVYPNPTRGTTTVRFSLDAPQRVTLAVYDVLGRRVLTRDLGAQPSGDGVHRLDTARLPAGVYLVRMAGEARARATARVIHH